MINNLHKISNVIPYKGNDSIYVGNGESLKIYHVGEGNIETKHEKLLLKNVMIVLEIKKNLLSLENSLLIIHVLYFLF